MITQQLKDEVSKALKAGDVKKVKTLRFVLSELQYKEIAKQKPLEDSEVVDFLRKEMKKRKEAIEMFKKGQRDDLVKDEESQLQYIEAYLPKQMPREELEKIVNEILLSVTDKSNIGKIIGMVMGKVKGQADGSEVAQLISQKLKEN